MSFKDYLLERDDFTGNTDLGNTTAGGELFGVKVYTVPGMSNDVAYTIPTDVAGYYNSDMQYTQWYTVKVGRVENAYPPEPKPAPEPPKPKARRIRWQ